MKKIQFDVDVDVVNRDEILKDLPAVTASISRDGKMVKHNTGVYFQDIPSDPFTGLSNIDHKAAEDLGYFKVDFLNVYMYEDIADEEQLVRLMHDPEWELLECKEIVEQLFHIKDYFWLTSKLKPTSVEQLAMLLAIIRPAKRYLANSTWAEIEQEIWIKPTDGNYHFKVSHAISYAMAIVVQLNLITEQLSG